MQCGLQRMQLRLGMQLNLRLRSFITMSVRSVTCCYYSCNETLLAPGAPRGGGGGGGGQALRLRSITMSVRSDTCCY